jgi:ubiquinone biosynthesis protein UbiJ
VTIGPRALETRRGDASSDLTLTASAPALALLIYGRADLAGMVRSGEVQATGDAALVERFARIFPRP